MHQLILLASALCQALSLVLGLEAVTRCSLGTVLAEGAARVEQGEHRALRKLLVVQSRYKNTEKMVVSNTVGSSRRSPIKD
jgi:hypothetical protein